MLPAPEIGIPAVEIAKFKERHGEALRRFRRMLERRLLDLAAGDPRLLHQRLDAVSEEIRDGIEEVQSLMRGASWRRIGRAAFWSVFVPTSSTIGTIATASHIATAISAASILPPVLSAFQQRRDIQEKIRTSPFAYAAFADRELTTTSHRRRTSGGHA